MKDVNIRKVQPTRNHPRGGYKARYRDPLGATRSKTFPNKQTARDFLAKVATEKARGEFIAPDHAATRFGEIADRWQKTLRLDRKEKTAVGYEEALRRHVRPAWDRVKVNAITYSAIEAWVHEMISAGRSASTIRAAYACLRMVMGYAVKDGCIRVNPCRGVRLPRSNEEEMLFLTAGQVRALAEAISPPYGALILFAAYTGLRSGEIAALRVGDVNWLARSVFVRRTLTDINGRLLETTPKTAKARRTVGIPAFVMDALREYVGERIGEPDRYLFTSERGGPLRFNNWRRRYFRPAVLRALPAELKGLRIHDLRHTYAAILVEQGAHPKEMADRMGHAKVEITLNRYAHVMPHLNQALTERLDAAYRDVTATTASNVAQMR